MCMQTMHRISKSLKKCSQVDEDSPLAKFPLDGPLIKGVTLAWLNDKQDYRRSGRVLRYVGCVCCCQAACQDGDGRVGRQSFCTSGQQVGLRDGEVTAGGRSNGEDQMLTRSHCILALTDAMCLLHLTVGQTKH